MKQYRVTTPDGEVVTVTLKEGASEDDIIKAANVKKVPQFEKDAQAIKDTSLKDLLMGSSFGRFFTGGTDAPVGAAQLGTHTLPFAQEYGSKLLPPGVSHALQALPAEKMQGGMDQFVKDREASVDRGDLAYGREGFDWMRLLGGASTPAALGIGKIAAPGAWSRIGQGGVIGTMFGASTPVEDTEDFASTKVTQAAAGGLLGATIPAGIEGTRFGLKVGKHVLEPFSKSGRQAIKGREYVAAAGDRVDDVVANLERNRRLVPGSKPTAAEAASPAGSAEFAATQRSVSGNRASDYLSRQNAQDAARRASVKTIAKTDKDLARAITLRETNAAKNYGDAWAKSVRGDPELQNIAQSPYFDTAFRDALKIAQTDGIRPDSVHFLHLVKRGLDKQLSGANLSKPLGGEEKRAVTGLNKRLVAWLEDKVPEYRTARLQFAKDSDPINRMRVGKEFEKVLDEPISDFGEIGKQRVKPFAAAMRDSSQIIKRADQEPRFGDLKAIFKDSPKELERLNRVVKDMVRQSQAQQQAAAGMKTTKSNIITRQLERETGSSSAPNPLHRGIMLFNQVLARIQGRAGEEVQGEMALEMLDPKIVAKAMRKAMIPQKTIDNFISALNSAQAPVVAGSAVAGSRDPDKTLRNAAGVVKTVSDTLWPFGP